MKILKEAAIYTFCFVLSVFQPIYATESIRPNDRITPVEEVGEAEIQTHMESLMIQVRSVNRSSLWEVAGTYAAADFTSGTDPAVVLSVAGTWKITASLCMNQVTASIPNAQEATFKLRRTNNTAADLAETEITVVLSTAGATNPTYTETCVVLSADAYTTTLTNDSITVFGDLTSSVPAGDIAVSFLDIYAERIF